MQSTTEAKSSQLGRFEAILYHLCNWKAIALLFAVIVAVDTFRAHDTRNWVMLLIFVALVAFAYPLWEIMRRLKHINDALEQLLGVDLDGQAHPEMAGTLERLRTWARDVMRC